MQRVGPKHEFKLEDTSFQVFHANKGEGLPKHDHLHSHLIICHSGSCIIRKETVEKVITKESGAFNLVAREWHEIEALEDNTVFENITYNN
jgi:hypothetical protein